MKHFKTMLLIAAAIGLTSTTACKKDNINAKKFQGPEFSMDKFDANLKASLQPAGAIGWGYVISQNGLFTKGGAFGKARNTVDGDLSFTINRKINIASVSKWYTAIAVMQLLEAKGFSVNTPVASFLPESWNRGPEVNKITFGELLGHTSGLSSYNTAFNRTLTWSGLQRMWDTGVVRSKNYDYLNANFALFRVIIPFMWKGMPGAPSMGTLDSAATEQFYIQYMQEHIFEPVGIVGADCEDESRANATLYYKTSDGQNSSGVYYGTWTPWAGGGGFYLTTMELAKVLAFYRHTEVLLSNASRKIMEDNRYGYERKDNDREVHGNYFPKGGSIGNTAGQGVLTQIVCFPNGVEIAVVFNTQGMVFAGGETSLRRAIYDAYNKSWE